MSAVTLTGLRCVRQRDGHGCGYCAASAVYRYYGLAPRKLGLRRRLGTDSNILPFLPRIEARMERLGWDTRGTLPPDMLAALRRDGLDTSCLAGRYASYADALRRHLVSGHPALAISALMDHWLVIAGADGSGVSVLDSSGYSDPDGRGRLRYRVAHADVDRVIGGVILVRRRRGARVREMTLADFAGAYAKGLGFAALCAGKALPAWAGTWLKP
jgi:hypothetical protein